MAEQTPTEELERIRDWIEQGRTDAWIAHKLSISGPDLIEYKVQLGLATEEELQAQPREDVDKEDQGQEAPTQEGEGQSQPDQPAPSWYEASFEHGERDGYGLWLDPAIQDDSVYREHWAGKKTVKVTIEPDQIVIRRA